MSRYCPSCGEELVDSAKFCKSCGAKLENVRPNENINENAGFEVPVVEKSYKTTIIIGYICAVLVPLIGFIIGIYLFTRKDSSQANRHAKYMMAAAVLIWIVSLMIMRF